MKFIHFLRRRFAFLVFLVICVQITTYAKVETYEFKFDKSTFKLKPIDGVKYFLLPQNRGFYYLGEDYPCLPIYPVTIAIPKGYSFDTFSAQVEMTSFQKGVQLTGCPVIQKTNSDILPSFFQYAHGQYPDSICKLRNYDSYNGVDLYHFEISPFSYNSQTRILNIAENVVLKIILKEEIANTERPGISDKERENYRLLETFVYNQEAIDSYQPDKNVNPSIPVRNPIQYLIVTADSLKESFLPLLNWKRVKGLYSKIITIEEIDRAYKGRDIQLKIKNCLKELYDNNGLKYVLLGGDDRIVPVRYCRGSQHVSNVISKIFEYETSPKYKGKFLCSGSEMFRSYQGKSDAEYKGGTLKNKIQRSWNGTVNELYDTNSNIQDDEGDEIRNTLPNFIKEVSSGYSFIENLSHGNETFIECAQNDVFAVKDAQNFKNEGHSIFTTISCLTNAFDSEINDPCLSEALIRSRDSGVVAYLGCSREGFGFSGKEGDDETNMDCLFWSIDFDFEFYNRLFSDNAYSRSYGDIVNMMKTSMIPNCFDYIYQWLMFGVNPIGDPEMSIYITEPKSFSYCTLAVDTDKLSIFSGEPDTKICISSIGYDDSYYKVLDVSEPVELTDLPKRYQVCLTKEGFIPRLFSVCNIQNEVFDTNCNLSFDLIRIGSDVESHAENGDVIFKSGTSRITGKEILIERGVEILKGSEVEFISE